jgi:ribulose-phosphate 3-epimerase
MLRQLRAARRGDQPALQLDGGVNQGTVRQIAEAGADAVIGGSFVFRHPRGIAAAVAALKQS